MHPDSASPYCLVVGQSHLMASVSPSVQGRVGPDQHLSDEFVPLKLKWWYGCFGGNLPRAALYVNVGIIVLPGVEEGLESSLRALLCGLQAAARSLPFACLVPTFTLETPRTISQSICHTFLTSAHYFFKKAFPNLCIIVCARYSL